MQPDAVNLIRIFSSSVTNSLCPCFSMISQSLEHELASHNNMDHLREKNKNQQLKFFVQYKIDLNSDLKKIQQRTHSTWMFKIKMLCVKLKCVFFFFRMEPCLKWPDYDKSLQFFDYAWHSANQKKSKSSEMQRIYHFLVNNGNFLLNSLLFASCTALHCVAIALECERIEEMRISF